MNSAIERLLTLRVADVMSKPVITVLTHDTMSHAAQVLLEHSISGVTVVDEQHGCAGVLSCLDFVKMQAGPMRQRLAEEYDEELVLGSMSSDVRCVTANQSLLSAARLMQAEHIHRLPVLDDAGRLLGMITSLDIVAALVNAIDE